MTDIIISLVLIALSVLGITYYVRKHYKSLIGKSSREIKSGRKQQLQSRKKAEKFFNELKREDSDSKILKELKRRKNAK